MSAPDTGNGRLGAEAVATAALTLAARGQLPSATAVQRELGRGSMVTVTKHLKAWAAANMPVMAGKATAPKWTARELEGMALVRKVFREEAAAALAEERAEAAEEVRVARETGAVATEQAKHADTARQRAEERAAGLETGMAALQEQLAAGARDREALNDQIVRLQATNAEQSKQYDQTVTDLRTQVSDAVARYDGMEKHMLTQIDLARTERDQIKARFEDDLHMANARQVRDSNQIETLRRANEELQGTITRLELELKDASTGRDNAERRLSVAEGQVTTLIERTDRLAMAQAGLSEQLMAAQRHAETTGREHQRLLRAAEALAEAVPAPEKEVSKDTRTRLSKAATALREAMNSTG